MLSVGSPSSRRAWIEMSSSRVSGVIWAVALLAEGVDRNNPPNGLFFLATPSPSSRRAWIEIT